MNLGAFFAELKRRNVYKVAISFMRCGKASPLSEIARLLMRFDHAARFVINANYNVNRSAGRETTEPKLGFFLVWADNTL
jgi:hypothetical protein